VYTAFGEQVVNTFADGASNRYGYVGAYGYQAHDSAEMPFLHVGARYYDPASGRFLQRDPIGIIGGSNVYAYVRSKPTISIDPSGLIGPGGGFDGHYYTGGGEKGKLFPKRKPKPKPKRPIKVFTPKGSEQAADCALCCLKKFGKSYVHYKSCLAGCLAK